MKEILQQLLTYSHEANGAFIHAIHAAPSANERVSVILSHILNAHRIWNARIGGVSPMGDPREVRPPTSWAAINVENYQRSMELLASEDIERFVEYRDMKGNSHRNRIRDILLHVVTHSTYHRGQLALLLGQEEKIPPSTAYIFYVRERGL